jgi:hypothetical protein
METNGTPSKTFDPGRYLTKVGSADYLEVKWRIVWFREIHGDDGSITTEMVDSGADWAIFRAVVSVGGKVVATGYGSEAINDFRDYLEKAETKAIGRALALAGFGTQFTPDHEFGAAHGAVVDSPIDFATTRGRRMPNNDGGGQVGQSGGGGGSGQPATPRQFKFIEAIIREHGLSDTDVAAEIVQLYGKALPELDRREASAYIERLQSRRNMVGSQS